MLRPSERGQGVRYVEGMAALVERAGGSVAWRKIEIHVAKNERSRAIEVLDALIRAVHNPSTAIAELTDPFSLISDDVRVNNALEQAGYDTIRSVMLAKDSELMKIRQINQAHVRSIRQVLIDKGFVKLVSVEDNLQIARKNIIANRCSTHS